MQPSDPSSALLPPRGLCTFRMRKSILSDSRSIPELVRETTRKISTLKGMKNLAQDFEIVLFEALANAIEHGNRYEENRLVFMRAYGAPGWGVSIVIRDEGEGFSPEKVPDPRDPEHLLREHGRGLFLMHQLMDRVEFRRGGREVLLIKRASHGNR